MIMRFDILSLFPEMFPGYFGQSLLKRAIERGLVEIHLHNIRDFAGGKHHQVDDRPFGGGPGMVFMVEPIVDSVRAVQAMLPSPGCLVMLTPQGAPLRQRNVEQLASSERLILLCGRYEGFDERIRDILQPQEISIGDYVLSGGELPAMVIVDAVMRLVPGVLGDEQSNQEDSFSGEDSLLESPQYTRPRDFHGHAVPEVLLGGDHQRIAQWRKEQQVQRTEQRRPDLWEKYKNREDNKKI